MRKRYRMDDEAEAQTSIPIIISSMGGDDGGSFMNPFGNMPTNNHIYFYEDVEDESILSLNKNILEINTSIKKEMTKYGDDVDYKMVPIYLHINSHGGDLLTAMAGIDTIIRSECPIYTIIEGAAASAATFLSVAGKKRFITKHSFMLIHQLSSAVWGKYEELKDEMENNEMFMKQIIEIYKEFTHLTDEQLDSMLKKDLWFNAEKCLEYGLVDKIL